MEEQRTDERAIKNQPCTRGGIGFTVIEYGQKVSKPANMGIGRLVLGRHAACTIGYRVDIDRR